MITETEYRVAEFHDSGGSARAGGCSCTCTCVCRCLCLCCFGTTAGVTDTIWSGIAAIPATAEGLVIAGAIFLIMP